MMLPIGGGRAAGVVEANGNQTETEPAAPPLASLAVDQAIATATVDEVTVQAVGTDAVEAAGWSRSTFTGNFGIVRQWLIAGADRDLIVSTIERLTARNPNKASGLGYFDRAVREAIAEGRTMQAKVERNEAWNAAMTRWAETGGFGKPPALADYVNQVA